MREDLDRLMKNKKILDLVKVMKPLDIAKVVAVEFELQPKDAARTAVDLIVRDAHRDAHREGLASPSIETNKQYPVPPTHKRKAPKLFEPEDLEEGPALSKPYTKTDITPKFVIKRWHFPPDPRDEPLGWPYDDMTKAGMEPKNKARKRPLTAARDPLSEQEEKTITFTNQYQKDWIISDANKGNLLCLTITSEDGENWKLAEFVNFYGIDDQKLLDLVNMGYWTMMEAMKQVPNYEYVIADHNHDKKRFSKDEEFWSNIVPGNIYNVKKSIEPEQPVDKEQFEQIVAGYNPEIKWTAADSEEEIQEGTKTYIFRRRNPFNPDHDLRMPGGDGPGGRGIYRKGIHNKDNSWSMRGSSSPKRGVPGWSASPQGAEFDRPDDPDIDKRIPNQGKKKESATQPQDYEPLYSKALSEKEPEIKKKKKVVIMPGDELNFEKQPNTGARLDPGFNYGGHSEPRSAGYRIYRRK